MSSPAPTPRQDPSQPAPPPFTKQDGLMGCGCAIIFVFVALLAYDNFREKRPMRLKPAIRETRTPGELEVRRHLESYARSAYWQGGSGEELAAPPAVAPEPRPGVSVYALCNRTTHDLTLMFDGTEIFELRVPGGGSVAIELKSGLYEYLVISTPGQNDPMPVAPCFRRLTFGGAHHEIYGAETAGPCRASHEPVRSVP